LYLKFFAEFPPVSRYKLVSFVGRPSPFWVCLKIGYPPIPDHVPLKFAISEGTPWKIGDTAIIFHCFKNNPYHIAMKKC
jgi:hypothetical protein